MDYHILRLKELGEELSVLYVEDDPSIQAEMRLFLGKFFTRVECASDGQEGLKLYESGHYDIVITDISMPLMDGLEMSQLIKRKNRDQIIIIVTAFTDSEYFAKAVQIGISGFILKPAQPSQIVNTVYDAAVRVAESKQNRAYRDSLETMVQERTKELLSSYVTDELTGLANYQKLKEDLQQAGRKSIVLLNVDNFDTINNSFGMEAGDEVLLRVAEAFRMLVPSGVTLYRTHGDEFAILLRENTKYSYDLALGVRAFFSQNKLSVSAGEQSISFTIGIDEGEGLEMLKNAKIAIREVRSLGKNRIQIYTPNTEYVREQKSRLLWIGRSRQAIDEDLFMPYFQPILDNQTGAIIKYEVLARMRFDEQIISPAMFIGPAKLAGLLPSVTRIMVDKSFAYFAKHEGNFSINIGDYDVKEGYLKTFLREKLDRYGIDPVRVTLEILESISVQDAKESISQLQELRAMGFSLAIDDFGTDSSNFSRLLDMQVEYIKIDGCFIKNLDTDENSQKITASIVAFARSMGAQVIAEFVHNEAVFDAVQKFGIEYSQGYFIGEPNASVEIKK